MKKYFFAAAFLAVFIFPACEKLLLDPAEVRSPLPSVHSSGLATILDSLRYSLDVPALAGAIVTDTGIVDAQAVGCRRYGGPVNVTNNDQFHLGSCSKVFTSVMMGILVDEGKVKWSTTLNEIFPEYTSIMRQEYKDVTVKNILSHTACFMRDPNGIDLKEPDPKGQRLEVLRWALQQQPAQKKGSFLYSNMGYVIAGAILEKLTSDTYEELIMNRIVKPLGLTTAGIGGPMGTPGLEDQPLQHTCNHAPLIASPDAGLLHLYDPAGGLYMSVGDWGKFIQWTIKAETGAQQTLLKEETAHAITDQVSSDAPGSYYGLGWGISYQDWAGGRVLSHSGSNGFNYCTAIVAIPKKFGVIVMTNQGAAGEEWPIGPAVNRLINYYLYKK